MENLIIRKAEPEDAEKIIILVKQVMEESPFFPGKAEEFKLTPKEEADYISNLALFLAAEVDGEIVGIATLDRSSLCRIKHTAMFGIAILKAYKRKGIGSVLINTIFKLARINGVEKIDLEVFENNKSALSLYKKFGFIKEGIKVKAIKTKYGYENMILMGRFL